MVMNNSPVRLSDIDKGDGPVSFDWEGLNEYERLAAKCFEEGVETSLRNHPPIMTIEPNTSCDDVNIEFWVPALGSGNDGPVWGFSMKEAFLDMETDYSPEDQEDYLKSLLAVVEHVRMLIVKGKTEWAGGKESDA